MIFNPLTNICRPVAALFAAAIVFAAAPAAADEEAETFIQIILDEAEPHLNAGDRKVMYDGIADLVEKYVDMRRVALFTLGQYARRISDEQREEFFPLFEEYATTIYQNVLSEYSGQKLKVANSVDRSERDIVVNSRIVGARAGDPFADVVVHWRVYRDRDGAMSLLDAGADNVWLAIEQRSQFTSIIANNGGGEQGMDALLAELRSKLAK